MSEVSPQVVDKPTVAKAEGLKGLGQKDTLYLAKSIYGSLSSQPEESLAKTFQQNNAEAEYLKRQVKSKNGRLDLKGHHNIALNDPDKLWLAVNVLYPKREAEIAYYAVQAAQIATLGGAVPKGWDAQKVHQALLRPSCTGVLASLNQRQIFYGDNATLKILEEETDKLRNAKEVRHASRRRFLRGAVVLGAAAVVGKGLFDGMPKTPKAPTTPATPKPPDTAVSKPAAKEAAVPLEKVTFQDLLKPLIEKTRRRRAERAAKEGPEYYRRVDKELNTDLINFGLAAWSEGRGESITILSYNTKTGQITTVSLTRETVTPEVIKFNQRKDPTRKDTYSRGFGSNMFLYNTGGFDLMRQVVEDETGLSADFQFYMDELALYDFIHDVLGDKVSIEVKKDLKLIDQDFDPRWRDGNASGRYTLGKGAYTMTAKEALRYVYAQEDDPILGPRDGPDRKNDLVKACFGAFSKVMLQDSLGTKVRFGAWMLRENAPLIGRIKTDFDPGDMLGLIAAIAPVISKINPAEFPSVGNEQFLLNDKLFGGEGMMRIINRYITPDGKPDVEYPNAHPNLQKLLDKTMDVMRQLKAKGINLDDEKVGLPGMGVLPLFGQVPISADPQAQNLIKDYWGSTRKVVKERFGAKPLRQK